MKSIITTLLTLALAMTVLTAEFSNSDPVAATRTINKLLVDGKFEEIYREWCHPHLQKQIDEGKFTESMKEDFGKGVIKLFADVVKAIDDKAGPEVIVAQPEEEKEQYEFILTKVKKDNPIGQKGSPWHIELQLHGGKWKLMDTD